ncbi:MAG: glycosyltransferase family 2 protein [Bacteroidota bacterium]
MQEGSALMFSIIIPTYNRAAFLPETLDSVLKQEYKHYEIILVDDGSTDDTRQVAQGYLEKHSRVSYYYTDNRERGAARNYGMKRARGEYLIFFDSDDNMHPNHLSVLTDAMRCQQYPDFLATKYQLSDGKQLYKTDIQSLDSGYYDYKLLLAGNPFSCNFCMKRLMNDLIFFNEMREYAAFEDWIFLVQNLTHRKIYVIDAITITMNDHQFRSMRQSNRKLLHKRLASTKYLLNQLTISKGEQNSVWANSYYFGAVHAYLENSRWDCFRFLTRAIKYRFDSKFVLLAVKAMLGKSLITKIVSR